MTMYVLHLSSLPWACQAGLDNSAYSGSDLGATWATLQMFAVLDSSYMLHAGLIHAWHCYNVKLAYFTSLGSICKANSSVNIRTCFLLQSNCAAGAM